MCQELYKVLKKKCTVGIAWALAQASDVCVIFTSL